MWFWFSVLALLCWSGSDLFSKIGCRDKDDKYAPLKMVSAVGVVMGLHALYGIVINHIEISCEILLTYLPVSMLYILSMAIGYLGLRYIELSVSSPICNSSGALVSILTIATAGMAAAAKLSLFAVALVCVGVVALGIVEMLEDDDLRLQRQEASNYKYSKSFVAILIPVIYCILDALGTFADAIVLERINEDSANTAYELTFLIIGIATAIYVYVLKKQRISFINSLPRFAGGICETVGQYFYIHALANSEYVMFSAPIISSYCIMSVLLSRIFLKEKMSIKHYLAIALVIIGIIVLGVTDP